MPVGQVETVAFWCGFIGTIVGIVLSLVAIVFSILVDRRSSKVSEHTIQSLQKIESVVERLSSDTRELIKAGWDKMLGGVERSNEAEPSASSAKQIAAGIAAELRSELATLKEVGGDQGGASKEKIENIEKYLKDLEASLMSQFGKIFSEAKPSEKLDDLLFTIKNLSPRSRALLSLIRRHHLDPMQYRRLSAGSLKDEVSELRQSGLLVPLVHGDVPCYYMPPAISRTVKVALTLLSKTDPHVSREVQAQLKAAGYNAFENEEDDRLDMAAFKREHQN